MTFKDEYARSLKLAMVTIWLCCNTFSTSEAFRLPTVQRTDAWFQHPHKAVSRVSFAPCSSLRQQTHLASTANNVDWGRKTVLQLQKELRSRGLSDRGTKTVLIQRLEALNTVKVHAPSPKPPKHNGNKKRLPGSVPFNGQSVSYRNSASSAASSSYEGSGASSYATSSYTKSYSAASDTQVTKKPQSALAQNQTMVDMDSDEARRIENYLRKVKQQQRIRQQRQQQQQQQQQRRSRPSQQQQRPPQQQRPQRTTTTTARTTYDAGQQLVADPFMTNRTPLQPPTPETSSSPKEDTIIDVTSTATYTKSSDKPNPPSSPPSAERNEESTYTNANFAASQQTRFYQPSQRSPPTTTSPPSVTPPPPSKKVDQEITVTIRPPVTPEQMKTVTATSTTSASTTKKPWNGSKQASREFLSFDKDDFLRPYDASVDRTTDDSITEIKLPPEYEDAAAAESSRVVPDLSQQTDDSMGQNAIEMSSSLADVYANYTKVPIGKKKKQEEEETVNGNTASVVNGNNTVGGDSKQEDVPKEVFFFDTHSEEEAKTNGAAVEDGLWTREEPYPFEVLGIEPGATMSEIRVAYRRKAMELSIDNNAEESEEVVEKLREVVAAFQLLSGGYKKGKYENEYQMLQRLQRRQEKEQVVETDEDQDSMDSPPLLKDLLPSKMFEQASLRFNASEPGLLPLQKDCFSAIAEGEDVVLNAPAESGKTLGYLLPLLAKLPNTRNASDMEVAAVAEQVIGGNNKRGRRRKRNRRNKLAAEVQELSQPCKPTLLFVAPSKDVALEIGKLCSQYHNSRDDAVAVVFDGVPVKKQKTLLQTSSLEIVVGTPTRLRKYIEMGVLDPTGIKTIAVDEADVMVDHLGAIEDIFVSIPSDDFQKVLTSKEMPSDLLEFCEDNMALTPKSTNFITLPKDDQDELQAEAQSESLEETQDETGEEVGGMEFETSIQNDSDDEIITVEVEVPAAKVPVELNTEVLAAMDHWHTATRTSDRPILSLDIIASMSPVPKVVVLFVPSDEEVESVATELELFHDTLVQTLTEDSTDESRIEMLDSIRSHSDGAGSETMILVTSDGAASSESNLPPADLILQYGIPRRPSNTNLYDANLYMTRVQRACGNNKNTQAMLLYDYEEEGRLLPGLQTEMEVDNEVVLKPRALPSPQHTLEASYLRTKAYCDRLDCIPMVVDSFEKQLKEDLTGIDDVDREDELIHRLAFAMAALSNPSKLKEEEGPSRS